MQTNLTRFETNDTSRKLQKKTTEPEQPASDPSTAGEETNSGPPVSFDAAPETYPELQSSNDAQSCLPLCTNQSSGTTEVVFDAISGEACIGMNPEFTQEFTPSQLKDIINPLVGGPCIVTGGGMRTPMGSGGIIARIDDYCITNDKFKITTTDICTFSRKPLLKYPEETKTRTRTIGSYKISIPEDEQAYEQVVNILDKYLRGTLQHIFPRDRDQNRRAIQLHEKFASLMPGDVINTPFYRTDLVVRSKPVESTALERNMHKHQPRKSSVLAATVENPRGKHYTIAIDSINDATWVAKIPNLYLSSPKDSPPYPNHPFYVNETNSAEQLSVAGTTETEQVDSDHELEESPLPHRRVRTPLSTIDGIGKKTTAKVSRLTEKPMCVESIGLTVFGEGYHENEKEIKDILSSLPNHEKILNHIENNIP